MSALKRVGWRAVGLLPTSWARAVIVRHRSGRWPNLRNPQGINDKINWRIVYDHRPIWDWTCDKLAAKKVAAERSQGILIPEVLWTGTDLRELADLPISGRWILKPNSSSHDVLPGQGQPDIAALLEATRDWNHAFTDHGLREYAYRHAQRVFVLERWIGSSDEPPADYKVFVFDGVAKAVQVHRNRFEGHRSSLYTRDWQRLLARQWHIKPDEIDVPRPEHLEEILRRAEEIGAGFDSIRVDLYDTAEGVWFGETTPYSWSGTAPFIPMEVELELGSYWTLPDRASLKRG